MQYVVLCHVYIWVLGSLYNFINMIESYDDYSFLIEIVNSFKNIWRSENSYFSWREERQYLYGGWGLLGFQQKCTPCGQLVGNKEENVVIKKIVLILRLLMEQGKDELRNKRIRRRGWRLEKMQEVGFEMVNLNVAYIIYL